MDKLASRVIAAYLEKNATIATGESCTGGMVGSALTAVGGSSQVYMGGIISYTNQVKHRFLGVPQELLDQYGAVSEPVALAMASGAREAMGTTVGVGITGVAGPGSDDWNNPVGLVYIAISTEETTKCLPCHFEGNRDDVRKQACETALAGLLEAL